MTFLPIVGRELRVAARKRSTFWIRVTAACVGLVVGGACLFVMSLVGSPRVGPALFGTLTWLSVVAALSSGLFFTSDSLSEEKREGTLGFLFLTDLRGYDVVGGKLLAMWLRGAYALLALFPVLGITLMMGGITGAEFWKTTLALLNALACSLTAGLFVSALSRDPQKAMAATLLLLLALVLGGPAVDRVLAWARGHNYEPFLSLLSPGYVFVNAGAWGQTPYWTALAATQIVCWILFAFACLVTPRAWQQRSRRGAGISNRAYAWKYGGAARRARLRRGLLDRNPVLWLACRERWQAVGMWSLSAIVVAGFVLLNVSAVPREAWMFWGYVGNLFSWFLYIWVASQACRFFVEARKSGLLELLLSSPVAEGRIVIGQWLALLRMFALPVGFLVAVQVAAAILSQLAFSRLMAQGGSPWETNLPLCIFSGVAAGVTSLGNLLALTWFGMWMGLTSKSVNWATIKTFLFVQVIPQMVIWFLGSVAGLLLIVPWIPKFAGSGAFPVMVWYPMLKLGVTTVLMLGKNIGFFLMARSRLSAKFRGYVAGSVNRATASTVPASNPAAPPMAFAQS